MSIPKINGINHITLAISDINQSFAFYKNVLCFKPLCKWDNGAYFLVGEDWLCLNVDENLQPNTAYTHYAFSVDQKNFKEICAHIVASNVIIFKENNSPGDSLYFLDPDGHKLEIHTGNWQSRIIEKQIDSGSWKNIIWYV